MTVRLQAQELANLFFSDTSVAKPTVEAVVDLKVNDQIILDYRLWLNQHTLESPYGYVGSLSDTKWAWLLEPLFCKSCIRHCGRVQTSQCL